jgi:hypothetical protein
MLIILIQACLVERVAGPGNYSNGSREQYSHLLKTLKTRVSNTPIRPQTIFQFMRESFVSWVNNFVVMFNK